METLSYEEFKKRYGTVGLAQAKQPSFAEKAKNYVTSNIANSFKSGVEQIKTGAKQISPSGGNNPFRGGLNVASGVLNTVTSPIAPITRPIAKGVEYGADKISNNPSVQRFANTGVGQQVARTSEDVANVANIAGTIGGSKLVAGKTKAGVSAVGNKVRETNNLIKNDFKNIVDGAPGNVSKIREIIDAKPPEPKAAMGQILQGQTKDISTGFKALKNIDLKDINTYKDFGGRIKEGIGTLAKQVDETLDLDTNLYKQKDLLSEAVTTGGKKIKTDYVARGLNQLKELYTSIGDDVEAGNLGELIRKVKTEGLTRRQVNDLARTYGEEFGSKAFGKTGEPLTSINAQLFEGTRKGLKEVARKGMEGTKAKALDENISNLYRIQKLIAKNEEAVNKLSQRIQERGLLEKMGHHASKVADILSGGSLRGMIGGLLPRGAGYKVMNALDLEQVLSRNLKIIEKALESGDDIATQKIIDKLSEPTSSPQSKTPTPVKVKVKEGEKPRKEQ